MASEKCCCLHVKTCGWIIAVVEVILSLIGVIQAIVVIVDPESNDEKAESTTTSGHVAPINGTTTMATTTESDSNKSLISSWIALVFAVIWFIFCLMLFFALKKHKPSLMIPHMIFTIIYAIICVIQIIIILVDSEGEKWYDIIVYVVIALLIIIFTVAEFRCYQWMKEYGAVGDA